MIDHQLATHQTIRKSIRMDASLNEVWEALTQPGLMKSWMSDSEIEIVTTWEVGSPMIIHVQEVSYKTAFTNTGIVLQFVKERILEYSHLSSISRLPDEAENYTIIRFTLQREGDHTLLELSLSNFPTESHYKHIDFYWTITLDVLKRFVEERH
ncbi:SRPBCC family protein [Mucilaginibacter sp. McL0603]|uniref:SRPBCC family protein n=1 Tax=Mucilaginibacter sp. McL0603 TaxID=3415670 RepID=UPI003CF5E0E5